MKKKKNFGRYFSFELTKYTFYNSIPKRDICDLAMFCEKPMIDT